MRVAQLDFADRAFPVSLVEVDDPVLPSPAWARVAVTSAGICGSDLHLFNRVTGPSPTLMGYVALPMQMGHEIAGRVIEAGAECPVAVGTRVAVDPVIGCAARAIDPPCPHCAAGVASVCHNIGSGVLTQGMGLGFTNGLGSGWADSVLAHHTQLHPLPDAVADDGAALHEPLSIAIHGLLRQPPHDGDAVVVVGAGIIGLSAVAAVHDMFPACSITVLARYPHQADAALRAGATSIVTPDPDDGHLEGLAAIAGTRVTGQPGDRMLAGGFPYVIEAVGSPAAVTEALRLVDGRGTVLLLGAAGVSEVDLTPIWFKEAALVGSFCHSADGGGHSVDRALAILAKGAMPLDVVTHRFPLADLRAAVGTALDRAAGAIKVHLHP